MTSRWRSAIGARPTPPSRVAVVVVLSSLAALAPGCRNGGEPPPAKPVSPGRALASTVVPAPPTSAPDPGAGVGRRVLRYRSVELTVPDWPVYDLERDPRRCVRWDAPATYLGAPGADQDCATAAVGAAGGVLAQPLPPGRLSSSLPDRDGTVTGHIAHFEGDPDQTGQLVVRIPDLGVGVTVQLGGSRRFGDDVLNSIKEVEK